MLRTRTKVLAGLLVLVSGVAVASAISSGGSGGAGAAVDVLAALVGKDVNANSYTATTSTGPAFYSTGDLVNAVRLGTAPRATIGVCNPGQPDVCIGPNDFGFTSKLVLWGDFTTQTIVARTFLDVQGSAYIINNAGPVMVTDTDGLVINNTTPIKGNVMARVTFDFPSITNNACSVQSVTVTGAALQDAVHANADFSLPADVSIGNARVTAANTVELKLCNHSSSGPQDPVSGAYVFEFRR